MKEPKNSVEELNLLGRKYGFSEKLKTKMSFTQYITFLGNTINIRNENMDPSDIAKLVGFCRREMFNAIIGIIKGIQNNNNSLLKDSERDADIEIQSILAMCYGSLTSSGRNLRAINKLDKCINISTSRSKILKQAKITLPLA